MHLLLHQNHSILEASLSLKVLISSNDFRTQNSIAMLFFLSPRLSTFSLSISNPLSFCLYSVTCCVFISSPKWSFQRFPDTLGRIQSARLWMGKKNIRPSGVLSTQSEHFTIHPSLLISSFQDGRLPWQPAMSCRAIISIHIAPLAGRWLFLFKAVIGLTFMMIYQMSCWTSIFY